MLAGHSYGAICAMGAALLHPVRKLVLYEPPFPVGGPVAGAHFGAYARAVADGDMETAIEIGLSKITRLSAAAIAAMRSTKAWLRLRTLAPSWTREMAALDSLPVSLDELPCACLPHVAAARKPEPGTSFEECRACGSPGSAQRACGSAGGTRPYGPARRA